VTDPKKPAKPVSMSKAAPSKAASPGADPAAGARPRTVVAATVALGVSAIAALGAATALYGETDWLHREQGEANSSAASSAVSHAVASASSTHANTASAAASASSVNATKYPTTGSRLDDQVSQQQTGGLIMSLVLVLATAIIAFGVYRGRHWSRWGVLAFWAIASFTGTFAGLTYLLSIGSDLPGTFKVAVFVSSVAMIAAVVLCQLRPSVEFFALSRPTHSGGGGQRRGLFTPRPPVDRGSAARTKPRSALTASAADRGEAYVQKQRAKKRSAANSEAVARGAELARQRAKASKSRRTPEG
jgi:hypothetical protein